MEYPAVEYQGTSGNSPVEYPVPRQDDLRCSVCSSRVREFVSRCCRGTVRPDKFPPDSSLADDGVTKDSTIEEFADKLMWGTYGRPAKSLQYKQLRELDTEHLENILTTQRQIPQVYTRAILFILRERAKPRLFAGLRRLANSI